ncbi:MAG: ribokinase, partial [Candidatus Dormibacteraeota bacterium]|nr:ribokinase [Candidatus Dormibacteraeota bacterium]
MTTGAGPRIVVVGSYVHVFTIQVPRAPLDGETVIASTSRADPGGKGSNQAVQMARLGAEVELLAVVGDDPAGATALELWRQEGVGARLVRTDPGLPTGLAFVILEASGKNRIAVDVGANAALGAPDVARAGAAIEA